MRTIIAGSRTITDSAVVEEAVRASGFAPSVVLSGTARGVDVLGEQWAANKRIPLERYPADWNKHGKAAGPIRNQQMADAAGPGGALVAIPGPGSVGTHDMIRRAKARGLKVYVHDLTARPAHVLDVDAERHGASGSLGAGVATRGSAVMADAPPLNTESEVP